MKLRSSNQQDIYQSAIKRWHTSKTTMTQSDIHLMNIQKSLRFYRLNVYLLNRAALKIQHFFFKSSYHSRKNEYLPMKMKRLNIQVKNLPLLRKATLQSEQDIIKEQNSMESERDQPQEETCYNEIMAKRIAIQQEWRKYRHESPQKSGKYFGQKRKLSATQSFLNMQSKTNTPIERESPDPKSLRSSWSNFPLKQELSKLQKNFKASQVNQRKQAATPVGFSSNKRFFENVRDEKHMNNSSPSTKSASSSRLKSTKSMSSLHSNNSTVARQKLRNRNDSGRVNHPKGWGVRQSSWRSCDIANLMQMVEKAWEDKKNSGQSANKKPNTKKYETPLEKTPTSFLKIEEQIQQIQASPQYFDKEREQAQKISRKSSSCNTSAKSQSRHQRNRSDIQQNPPETNKFITLTQNGLLLNTTGIKAQYMTPKHSDANMMIKEDITPQSSSKLMNTKGWQNQIIEALTQNPPQFFDSKRLSTFAKHKLDVAQNVCKQNTNPLTSSRCKSTAHLHQNSQTKSSQNKRCITPLSQQRSMKNLTLYDFNGKRKYSDPSTPLLLNASIIPQTCKHDLSLNFDFKLHQDENDPPIFGKKMLNRPPSELKAISLYSDRKNQINLHAKSKSIENSNKKRVNAGSVKNRRNNSAGGSLNKNRFVTTCGGGSSSTSLSVQNSNSLKLKKSKRYANVESKVKRMIEETTSATVIKHRNPTQVCIPVTLSTIHMEESEFLQQQQQQQYDQTNPIQDGYDNSEKRKASYLPFQRHKRQTSLQNGGSHLMGKNLFGQQTNPTSTNRKLFERHQSVPKLELEASLQFTVQKSSSNIMQDDAYDQKQSSKQREALLDYADTASVTPISSNNSRMKQKTKVPPNLFVIADNLCEQEDETPTISSISQEQIYSEKQTKKHDMDTELKKLNDQFYDITSSIQRAQKKQNLEVVTLTSFQTNESLKGVKKSSSSSVKKHRSNEEQNLNQISPTKRLATTTITSYNGVGKQGVKKLKKSSAVIFYGGALGNIQEEEDNNNSFSFAEESCQNSTGGDFGAIVSIAHSSSNKTTEKMKSRAPFKQIIN